MYPMKQKYCNVIFYQFRCPIAKSFLSEAKTNNVTETALIINQE